MFRFFFSYNGWGFGVSSQFRSCQKVIKKHPFSCFGVYFQRISSCSSNTLCLLCTYCVSIIVFRLALEKDPGYVRGLVLMGQTLLQKTQLSEATEYLERAISKVRNGFWVLISIELFISQWPVDDLVGFGLGLFCTQQQNSLCSFLSSLMRLHLMLRMLNF